MKIIVGLRAVGWIGLVTAAAAAAATCQQGSTVGGERQSCRKPDGDQPVCAPGLTCMSGLCVRPPPADCAVVAEALVSLEVGNYAPREERAAALPAKRALCEKLKISATEGECLAKATDPWSAGACVPRLYPEAESSGCEPVAAKLRALIAGQMGGSTDPTAQAMMDKVLGVIRQSCVEDAWPEPLRRCILAAPADNLDGFTACEKLIPAALKEKMEERMRKAM